MENEKHEEEKMPLTSHLEELKTRLIRILIVVGIGFGVCYLFKDWSFRVITKPLVDAMPAQSSMIFTGLPEAFFIHMKIAFFASLFLTAPYTLFEIWRFVSPGLYKNERRFVFPGWALFSRLSSATISAKEPYCSFIPSSSLILFMDWHPNLCFIPW
jgi:sec-independent protein translocase protein TatC